MYVLRKHNQSLAEMFVKCIIVVKDIDVWQHVTNGTDVGTLPHETISPLIKWLNFMSFSFVHVATICVAIVAS